MAYRPNPIQWDSFLTKAPVPDASAGARNAIAGWAQKNANDHFAEEQDRLHKEFERSEQLKAQELYADTFAKQQDFEEKKRIKRQETIKQFLEEGAKDPKKADLFRPLLSAAGVSYERTPEGTYRFFDTETGEDAQRPTKPESAQVRSAAPGEDPYDYIQSTKPSMKATAEAQLAPKLSPEEELAKAQSERDQRDTIDADEEADASLTGEEDPYITKSERKETYGKRGLAPVTQGQLAAEGARNKGKVTEDYSDVAPPEEIQAGLETAPQVEAPEGPKTEGPVDFSESGMQAADDRINRGLAALEAAKQTVQQQAPQAPQAPISMTGADWGTFDPRAYQDMNQGRVRGVVEGFYQSLYPEADKQWVKSQADALLAQQSLNSAPEAVDYLQKVVVPLLGRWSGERAAKAMAGRPQKGPAGNRDADRFDKWVSDEENKQFKIPAMEQADQQAAKLEELAKSDNAIADRMMVGAQLKATFSSVTSDKELKFMQEAGGVINRIETALSNWFGGGELPANYKAMMAEASEAVKAATQKQRQRAYDTAVRQLGRRRDLTGAVPDWRAYLADRWNVTPSGGSDGGAVPPTLTLEQLQQALGDD